MDTASPNPVPAIASHDAAILVPAVPKLGVLMNKKSGRNRSGTAAVEAILATRPDISVRRTDHAHDVPTALAELASDGVNVLAINGGDGSLQAVLNALLHESSPFARRPLLAILPGGTTNMIAYDVGSHRKPGEELKRLVARLDAGTLVESVLIRPVMEASGGDIPGLAHGFFFGAAGVYEGTMANRVSVDAVGGRDGAGPAWRILNIALALLLGRDPVTPVPIQLNIGSKRDQVAPYLAVFGTTMDRLSLNLQPFWGEAGSGPIRLTLITKGARKLLRLAPSILRGRAHPGLTAANGYDSLRSDSLTLEFTGGLVLDGEIFHASVGHPIRLRATQHVAFARG